MVRSSRFVFFYHEQFTFRFLLFTFQVRTGSTFRLLSVHFCPLIGSLFKFG